MNQHWNENMHLSSQQHQHELQRQAEAERLARIARSGRAVNGRSLLARLGEQLVMLGEQLQEQPAQPELKRRLSDG